MGEGPGCMTRPLTHFQLSTLVLPCTYTLGYPLCYHVMVREGAMAPLVQTVAIVGTGVVGRGGGGTESVTTGMVRSRSGGQVVRSASVSAFQGCRKG